MRQKHLTPHNLQMLKTNLAQEKALTANLVPEMGLPESGEQEPSADPRKPSSHAPKVEVQPQWPEALRRKEAHTGQSHFYRSLLANCTRRSHSTSSFSAFCEIQALPPSIHI